MMKPEDIVPAFLESCPGLSRPWREHLEFWGDAPDRGLFNDLAVIAQHAVDLYERADEAGLRVLFDLVERCLTEGNEDVQGLVSVGILETAQTLAANRSYDSRIFEPWLSNRTRKVWGQLAAMWTGMPRPASRLRRAGAVGGTAQREESGLRRILDDLYGTKGS